MLNFRFLLRSTVSRQDASGKAGNGSEKIGAYILTTLTFHHTSYDMNTATKSERYLVLVERDRDQQPSEFRHSREAVRFFRDVPGFARIIGPDGNLVCTKGSPKTLSF